MDLGRLDSDHLLLVIDLVKRRGNARLVSSLAFREKKISRNLMNIQSTVQLSK